MAHATDDFNRAGPELGPNWTVARGGMVIDSNRVRGDATTDDSMAFWNAATFGSAQYAQITLTALDGTAWIGVCLRATDGDNYYTYYTNGTYYEVSRYLAGSFTILFQEARSFVAGDMLRFEADGSRLRALHNSQVIVTVTDSSHPTGAPGVTYWTPSTTTSNGDSWEGGDLCRPPAPAIQSPAPAITYWPVITWINARRPIAAPPQTRAGPQPLVVADLAPTPIAPSQWLEAPRVLAPSLGTAHAAPRIAGQAIIAQPSFAPSLIIMRGRATIAQPATHITASLTADQVTALVEPDI